MKYITGRRSFELSKDFFDVEKIITRRFDGKNKFYLIKWVGYPLEDCSWEPISHLQNIGDMVENFDKNFPKSIDKKRLKQYLSVIHRKKSHIIKIKNPFLKNRGFKNRKIKRKNNIIICINNSENINSEIEEKKEEEKEIENEIKNETEKEIKETVINDSETGKETEKNKLNFGQNLSELNIINSDINNYPKLIRPILIW